MAAGSSIAIATDTREKVDNFLKADFLDLGGRNNQAVYKNVGWLNFEDQTSNPTINSNTQVIVCQDTGTGGGTTLNTINTGADRMRTIQKEISIGGFFSNTYELSCSVYNGDLRNYFAIGDTVQITGSASNNRLFTVRAITYNVGTSIFFNETVVDEPTFSTIIVYNRSKIVFSSSVAINGSGNAPLQTGDQLLLTGSNPIAGTYAVQSFGTVGGTYSVKITPPLTISLYDGLIFNGSPVLGYSFIAPNTLKLPAINMTAFIFQGDNIRFASTFYNNRSFTVSSITYTAGSNNGTTIIFAQSVSPEADVTDIQMYNETARPFSVARSVPSTTAVKYPSVGNELGNNFKGYKWSYRSFLIRDTGAAGTNEIIYQNLIGPSINQAISSCLFNPATKAIAGDNASAINFPNCGIVSPPPPPAPTGNLTVKVRTVWASYGFAAVVEQSVVKASPLAPGGSGFNSGTDAFIYFKTLPFQGGNGATCVILPRIRIKIWFVKKSDNSLLQVCDYTSTKWQNYSSIMTSVASAMQGFVQAPPAGPTKPLRGVVANNPAAGTDIQGCLRVNYYSADWDFDATWVEITYPDAPITSHTGNIKVEVYNAGATSTILTTSSFSQTKSVNNATTETSFTTGLPAGSYENIRISVTSSLTDDHPLVNATVSQTGNTNVTLLEAGPVRVMSPTADPNNRYTPTNYVLPDTIGNTNWKTQTTFVTDFQNPRAVPPPAYSITDPTWLNMTSQAAELVVSFNESLFNRGLGNPAV